MHFNSINVTSKNYEQILNHMVFDKIQLLLQLQQIQLLEK